jgi:hypothetical protein
VFIIEILEVSTMGDRSYRKHVLFSIIVVFLLLSGCFGTNEPEPSPTRIESIPSQAQKQSPENDVFPPIVHSSEWKEPVPLPGPINTAGAEDSPFITLDDKNLYFSFTPDVKMPPEKQLIDGVSGLWWSKLKDGNWSEPERIILSDDVALDGAAFVLGDILWFASVREGNYGEVDIYTAEMEYGRWSNVKNAGKQLNREYDVGEMYITWDGLTLYCGGYEEGDPRGKDIYRLHKNEEGWSEPVTLPSPINTNEYNEDQPFITADGNELWFTGQSRLGYSGPAVFRCKNINGSWGEPKEMISNFAGEPTLDSDGNIYFVHHFFSEDMDMIEADIYVAYKR